MGFFKKVGKSVGGALKSASKVVSLKNAINLAINPTSALSIGKEALGRAVQGATSKQVKQVEQIVANEAANVGSAAPVYDVVTKSGQRLSMTAKNAATAVASGDAELAPDTAQQVAATAKAASNDDGFLSWLKTLAGGAASAAGVKLAGNEAANAAAGDAALTIGKVSASTWLKNNWWKILLPVGVIAGIVYYAKRKPKARWRR